MNLNENYNLLQAVAKRTLNSVAPGQLCHVAIISPMTTSTLHQGHAGCQLDNDEVCLACEAINKFAGYLGNTIRCEGYQEADFTHIRTFSTDLIQKAYDEEFTMDIEEAKMLLLMKCAATKCEQNAKYGQYYMAIVEYDDDSGVVYFNEFHNAHDVQVWYDRTNAE